jgi:hypothetical protein
MLHNISGWASLRDIVKALQMFVFFWLKTKSEFTLVKTLSVVTNEKNLEVLQSYKRRNAFDALSNTFFNANL